MDIRCTTCGEPWDIDSLHDYIAENYEEASGDQYQAFFREARGTFSRLGCVMFGTDHNSVPDEGRAAVSSMLFDILGDDVDGIAAEMEDAEYMGLFD